MDTNNTIKFENEEIIEASYSFIYFTSLDRKNDCYIFYLYLQ